MIISRQIRQLKDFFLFFSTKLRLSNPWNYKVPFLISIPYFVFLISENAAENASYAVLASLAIIIGVAGMGYLINDLGDVKKDALIHKQNAASNLSVFNIVILLMFFLALALIPWLYLPFTYLSLGLLIFQFFLFCMYSFPPLRLKEKGFWGILTDSLYAHVNPSILAAYTFHLLLPKSVTGFNIFLIVLCIWQLFLGVRNIVFHQIKDYEDDLHSGTKTFVTTFSSVSAVKLCIKFLIPMEIFTFLIFTVVISRANYFFILMVNLYWIVIYLRNKSKLPELNFRDRAYLFLDDLYMKWIPLFVLVLLCIHDIHFYPILILHFIIFRNDIKSYHLHPRRWLSKGSRLYYRALKFITPKKD